MRQLLLFLLLAISITSFAQNSMSQPFKKLQGLSHPESIVYDKEMEVFYVSNMAGKEDNDGFISKISKAGEIQDTLWVKNLNDPKGLLVQEDRVFVTDVTSLVEIDRKTGKILNRKKVENAKSLNDIAADHEGNLFISDLAGNVIYKMDTSGRIIEWLKDVKLERPNGLLISGNHLFVASWGKEEPGNFLKVNTRTKEIQQVTTSGIGNLDGIQEVKPNSFYISDWGSGNIFHIDSNGTMKKVVESAKSSGDILFLKDTGELVIPMNHQNALWWYRPE